MFPSNADRDVLTLRLPRATAIHEKGAERRKRDASAPLRWLYRRWDSDEGLYGSGFVHETLRVLPLKEEVLPAVAGCSATVEHRHFIAADNGDHQGQRGDLTSAARSCRQGLAAGTVLVLSVTQAPSCCPESYTGVMEPPNMESLLWNFLGGGDGLARSAADLPAPAVEAGFEISRVAGKRDRAHVLTLMTFLRILAKAIA